MDHKAEALKCVEAVTQLEQVVKGKEITVLENQVIQDACSRALLAGIIHAILSLKKED